MDALKKKIEEAVRREGIDLIGFAPKSRFDALPVEKNPFTIFPEGETVIMVRVPYAEVISYTKDLRAMTRGSGSYYIELEGYDPAPADVTKKLVEAYQASKA